MEPLRLWLSKIFSRQKISTAVVKQYADVVSELSSCDNDSTTTTAAVATTCECKLLSEYTSTSICCRQCNDKVDRAMQPFARQFWKMYWSTIAMLFATKTPYIYTPKTKIDIQPKVVTVKREGSESSTESTGCCIQHPKTTTPGITKKGNFARTLKWKGLK